MLVHMCKYVDLKGSPAIKRIAGVVPEVNVRNLLLIGKKACKQGIHLGFETPELTSQKRGISGLTKRETGALQFLLSIAYVVRREGYVLTRVCLSVNRGGGFTPARSSWGEGVPQLGGIPKVGYPLPGQV